MVEIIIMSSSTDFDNNFDVKVIVTAVSSKANINRAITVDLEIHRNCKKCGHLECFSYNPKTVLNGYVGEFIGHILRDKYIGSIDETKAFQASCLKCTKLVAPELEIAN